MLALVLAAAPLASCGETTPAGPLGGTLDFTPSLPKGIEVPTGEGLESHAEAFELGPRDGRAEVELRWRTFKGGRTLYIADMDVELTSPGKGLAIRVGRVGSPVNIGTLEAPVEMVQIALIWERKSLRATESGTHMVAVAGDGTLSEEPGEPG